MKGEVDPKFLVLAKRVLSERPVICDIGSRDAREGIYLAQELGARELHVFEPNPPAASLCRQNLASFTKASTCFNEVAVTDRAGELNFYPVNPELSNNKDIGFSSFFRINPKYMKRRGQFVQNEIRVNATTLDMYFRGKQVPELLWIDVEGAELQVLRGASNVLRLVRLIHIEVSFRPMQIGKPLFWEIEDFLATYNFKLFGFMEVKALRTFLYRRRLLPSLPWRLNAVFYRARQ